MNSRVAFLMTAALAPLAALAIGCSSSSAAPIADNPGPTVVPIDADSEKAASVPDAESPRPQPRALGSPLCNAPAWMGCYPDRIKTNANDCSLSQDGGSYGPMVGNEMPQPACHVQRTGIDGGVEPVCTSAGGAKDGVSCGGPTECAPGYECVGQETQGRCQPYCCLGDCAHRDQFCDIQPTTFDPTVRIPVCMPIHSCGLLDSEGGTCPAAETCAVVRVDDGVTGCVPVGPKHAGEECNTDNCARGLTCLGTSPDRTCYVLCHTDPRATECASTMKHICKGGNPLFPVPGIGICE